ncbi:glutaminase A [bacterium]|nr:MAG: glutaminase A [bacterium]
MQQLLEQAIRYAKPFLEQGKLADYIPALLRANPQHLGVSITTMDGKQHSAGDTDEPFSIQSISKILSLIYVLNERGKEKVLEKVGVEPSGNPFYSLVQLEYESGKPRNPLINAGAIAITGLMAGNSAQEKSAGLIQFLNNIVDESDYKINQEIYRSEFETSHRNRAVGYFMKHFGMIDGEVEAAVDAYFQQCSIEMTCAQLSRLSLFFAGGGTDPISHKKVTDPENVKWVHALMAMCGLYDASGEFACTVGLPGKSGVGGGIVAIVPGKMSISVFGPALDGKGNSIGGLKILEFLSRELRLSLF